VSPPLQKVGGACVPVHPWTVAFRGRGAGSAPSN